MKIGIDIDDTITNSSKVFIKYAKKYNEKNKIIYKINTNELNQAKAFGWSTKNQQEFKKIYLKEILEKATPNKNAVKIIKELKNNKNEIYFITARSDAEVPNMYEFTKAWLTKNHIPFDKLIVNCVNKANECQKEEIDIFIDDNYDMCEEVNKKMKIQVMLYTTTYNKKYINLPFKRVNNWQEIKNTIEKEGKI